MLREGMRPPSKPPPPAPKRDNVTSIADELERRRWQRLRTESLALHQRGVEARIESIDRAMELKEMDFEGMLAALDSVPGATPRDKAGLRCLRAQHNCLSGNVEAGLAEWAEVM